MLHRLRRDSFFSPCRASYEYNDAKMVPERWSQSDNFVMGFDAFQEAYDEYGNADNDGMMEGVLILLDPRGRPMETITSVPGGMYPEGRRAAKTAMPQIIDVRLD